MSRVHMLYVLTALHVGVCSSTSVWHSLQISARVLDAYGGMQQPQRATSLVLRGAVVLGGSATKDSPPESIQRIAATTQPFLGCMEDNIERHLTLLLDI